MRLGFGTAMAVGAGATLLIAPTLRGQEEGSPSAGVATAAGSAATSPVAPGGMVAQGATSSGRLAPVVVTATRTEEDPFNAPNAVSTESVEEFLEGGFRTFPEMLRETPGVMVQRTGHGQGSPFIRGFTGFRNLLLVDGIRLNNSVFRDGPNQYWNTVDPYSLSRTEIVRGQGSVLFGSDAIGGVVNALTQGSDPLAREDGRFFYGGDALYRFSSAEESHTGRVAVEMGQGGRLGIRLGATLKEYGDLRAGNGSQSHTGYDEWDIDGRLDFLVNDRLTLTLAHQQVHQDDAWRTHRTIYGRPWRGTTIGNEQQRSLDQDRTLTYLQVAGRDLGGFIDGFRASASYQTQEERRVRVRRKGDDRSDESGFDVGTIGTWVQFESGSPIGEFVYGASWYHDEVDSFSKRFNADGSFDRRDIQGPVGDDSSYDLVGAFTQLDAPVVDTLHLLLGGRFTYASADVGRAEDPVTGDPISFSDDWTNLSGSARLVWTPGGDDRFRVFGGVSQGFRAPNLSDLSRLDTARSDEIETPSPGLDPEEFVTWEIGVRGRSGGGALTGQVSWFHTSMDDVIVRTPTGRMIDGDAEVTKRNGGDGFIHGIEAEASALLPAGFSIFGNLTWLEGEEDTYPTSDARKVREPVSRLMPTTALAGLRWDSAGGGLWIEVAGRFADRADRLSSRDRSDTDRIPPGGTPSYAVGDLRAGWRIAEHFTLMAALENFTDEAYRIHGSGLNEAGRNFVVSGRLEF